MTRALPSAFQTVANALLGVAKTCAVIGLVYGGFQGINGASVSQSFSSSYACASTILEMPRHAASREWGADSGVVSFLNVLIPLAQDSGAAALRAWAQRRERSAFRFAAGF